jgi:hypothetical protein
MGLRVAFMREGEESLQVIRAGEVLAGERLAHRSRFLAGIPPPTICACQPSLRWTVRSSIPLNSNHLS